MGSLIGIGITQLQSVLLIGILIVAIFKPESVCNWSTFRLSVLFLVLGIVVPSLVSLMPFKMEDIRYLQTWYIKMFFSLGGIFTAVSIYFLALCLRMSDPTQKG